MPLTLIDPMNNAAPWQALAPDGVTPSTELSLTIDTSGPRADTSEITARVTASANATGHRLRRTFGGLDLSTFDELRLWINGSRAADGSATQPFFLKMRLGSASMPIDAAGNTWQRLLPVSQAQLWQPVRLSIGDLPAAVRGAVTAMDLLCVGGGFSCNLDDIAAVRDAMVTDVDAALRAKLNGILKINGQAVPAVLHPANGTLGQARPYIQILHYDVIYARERTEATRPRRDFTDRGYALRPPSNAYDLFYQVTAVADDRGTQSAMLEFILGALAPNGQIEVNNDLLPMEAVKVWPRDRLGGSRSDIIPLFYRISTRQEVAAAAEAVVPPKTIDIETDSFAVLP
jgi:hypothetical protein